MTKDEALKLALEYLRDNQHYIADNERHAYVMEYNAFVEHLEALAEQPAQQQEPVAEVLNERGDVDWISFVPIAGTLLYTSPPASKPWVGLTRAERFEIEKAMSKYYDYQHECKTVCLPEFARAIEAKLREKNA